MGAISDFKRWLRFTSVCVAELTLRRALDTISRLVWRDYRAEVWFVEINGPRWSYLAGHVSNAPADADLRLIELDDHLGMVCSDLGELTSAHLDAMVDFVNELLSERAYCHRSQETGRESLGGEETAL
ncbi:MAG TPA: hypothetical protein PLF13_09330 [candidate division Zixibacteria bacterium]|nr:hypothetical protein [candidate division Zixibacteria bacterium]